MELKVPSTKHGGLSPHDCASDPEEKEVSDEDDDDRNHKHRRRETRSQSMERDPLNQPFSRPYRKRNKAFENGHPFRENESQASGTSKNFYFSPQEKDSMAKSERRRPGLTSFSRVHLDLNQRIRANHPFTGDTGPVRGRGRESWTQRDSKFNSVDIASQMIQPGSVAPNLFVGRGLPNVSNAQSPSWGAFGLMPAIPNGGLDTLHSIGLQGALRPSLNLGIPRQRCRDFEERGFCLRGDMCPMEHGVNRIVVEDVQSLSQFNLPVSLPSAQLLATPAGPGPLPSVAPSTASMNSKAVHSKISQSGMTDDDLALNGAYTGADLYDPDQPLWNDRGPEASAALKALGSPKADETETLLNDDISERHHVRSRYNPNNDLMRSSGSQNPSSSVWGRIGGLRNRLDAKEKMDAASSDYFENETKDGQDLLPTSQSISRQGKQISVDDDGSKGLDSTLKSQSDGKHNSRKPSQKAQRTLFVNGIPKESNKREALLSHFCKFGEVIDIYIPLNTPRAFVQFSKREEAEAALKAPDAVMGNRFIRLWWANRDSIPDDSTGSGNTVPVTPHGTTAASITSQSSVANRGKDNLLPVAQKSNALQGANVTASESPLPINTNDPKVPPPSQKKLEMLEQLKDELRKKQELLDQKRKDFRRQLDKLAIVKQATGVKSEPLAEQAAKRHKVGIAADPAKSGTGKSSDLGAEAVPDKNKSSEHVVCSSPKLNIAVVAQDCQLTPGRAPLMMNRYTFDNQPTAFRVLPPLPIGFLNVTVLKEHFSQYGDLSAVELEDVEAPDGDNGSETLKNCSVHVSFSTCHQAERAFVNGNCWDGHNLKFAWLMPDNPSNENPLITIKGPLDADVQTEDKMTSNISTEAVAAGGEGSARS
ncbi:hypothetical protein SLE2022_280690 [Rubroshorea leprosula]